MSSFKPIDFKSSWKKEEQRHDIRQARNVVLEQAKARYEREERKKEEAKLRGEDTWMLPVISNRIDQEAEKVKPKKKKKEKKKKNKKSKKLKKKLKEGRVTASSCSSDESDSDEKWVVKDTAASNAAPVVKGPRLERDDWMTAPIDPLSSLPCVSRDELRAKRKEEKEKENVKKESVIEQVGQHARELNPYWKDGGTGLPEEAPAESKKAAAAAPKGVAGDGGLAWWQKAYQRCVEQAKEEGRSLEDVASDRYGSLEMLEGMLAKAKDAQRQKEEEEEMWKASSRRKDTGRDRNRDRDRDRHRSRSRERRKRSRSRDRQRTRDGSRSRSRDRQRTRDGSRSRSRERYKSSRPRSRSRDRRSRSRSRGRYRSRSRSRERYKSSRQRSRSRDRKGSSYSGDLRLSQLKSRKFKKPGDSSDSDTDKKPYSSSSRDAKRKDSVPAWKKRGFVKPRDEDDSEETRPSKRSSSPDFDANRDRKRRHQITVEAGTSSSHSAPGWKKAGVKNETRGAASRGRASGSSLESSGSQSASESDSESEDEPPPPPPPKKPARVLTQEEMNKLGSKLVRAEILGNQAEVDRLKAELAEARKAQEEAATAPGTGAGAGPAAAAAGKDDSRNRDAEEEDKVVVLTRTNKHGMVRPLPASKHHPEPHRGRRKQKAVATHTGKERECYFDDDDQHDLKTLVERERMGTAEDQHAMFSRLAGKSFDKTDEDWQVDDVFVSRAARKQASGREEERQKMMAVKEHRKMASALEKCPFCLDNVPKHLIVAMGIKVYVCLPNHRSLTEGHCLIVPMQHVTQGTLVDEDVWDEIQVFRKGLTRMFEDREEDCVFMETSMHLKRQPHMVVECVPMPREVGDLAPIYFKKAIQDSETEWAQNKKLVDLKGRDVRKAVPKGFPYFSVDFGTQSGFAHVIEDEIKFTRYFGKEIVGGMLDVEPQLWRKPPKENFEHQRTKVLQFAEWWKDYDWTQDIHKDSD